MKEITDLQIGTWNVRSLFRAGALTISLSCLERYEMDITAIQEVRWTSSGSFKSQGINRVYNILYDSLPADKPKIVIGDLNGKIGKETIYKPTIGSDSLHEESNDNGNKLISFAAARNM
ncbi:Endonuclease/exonuclease/phosphatase [Cinara cedri]|uniref:Endonuclease/exonuclease/phosphatase n=1 Tax=Cinara cedri TaxID=506608 RepID=A0A5E4LZP0_9HEMI|nr:Endonuclease/exonuclease/phosphatase [Cinara cedri]